MADQDPLQGLAALARVVSEKRTLLRLSRAELAQRAGISLGTIKNLEHGRYHPTTATLQRVAVALSLSLESFGPLLVEDARPLRAQLLAEAFLLEEVAKRLRVLADRYPPPPSQEESR